MSTEERPNKRARISPLEGQVVCDNFIDGKWTPPKAGKYLDIENPSNGQVVGKVALSDADDVAAAVAAAAEAYKSWNGMGVKARMKYLMRLHQIMTRDIEDLVKIVTLEHGKTFTEAYGDVAKGMETLEWAIGMPQLIAGRNLIVSGGGIECKEQRQSLGVVASIVPFNFPAMVPFWTLPIAIAAGNTFILKPSEKVPMTFGRIMEMIHEAGIPNGVVQVINGQAEAVTSLCDHDGVKAVTFVGSTKVAEIVAKRCRAINKKVLALGGAKNHLVALPDCNQDMAAQDIVNSYCGCAGERCMAASALLLIGDQSKLLDLVVAKSKELTAGHGEEYYGKKKNAGRQMGPIIDKPSLDRITRYITEAEANGSKILLDGRKWTEEKKEGYWIGPTVIMCKSKDDPAMTDEIFGPVISVLQVASKEEAIAVENGNPYGNAACIYTSVGKHAQWFTERFSAAMIGVNIGVPVPREPFSFGGMNRSKFGDFDITGDGALEFFTIRRKITTKWTPPPKGQATWMD